MRFQVIELSDGLIEVEQVETGQRLTFDILADRTDLARRSFIRVSERGPAAAPHWKQGYICARRAAVAAGLLQP